MKKLFDHGKKKVLVEEDRYPDESVEYGNGYPDEIEYPEDYEGQEEYLEEAEYEIQGECPEEVEYEGEYPEEEAEYEIQGEYPEEAEYEGEYPEEEAEYEGQGEYPEEEAGLEAQGEYPEEEAEYEGQKEYPEEESEYEIPEEYWEEEAEYETECEARDAYSEEEYEVEYEGQDEREYQEEYTPQDMYPGEEIAYPSEYEAQEYETTDITYEDSEEYYIGELINEEPEDGMYADQEEDSGYEEEFYEQDETAGNAGRSRKSVSVFTKISAAICGMDVMDRIMVIVSAIVLILAIVTIIVFISTRMAGSHVAAFADVGSQLEGIDTIGGEGLAAVADAEMARISALSVLPEPTAEPEESAPPKEYDEVDYKRQVAVEPDFTSIQKDLKIKFINARTNKLVPNVPFSVTITDPDGKSYIWSDDDMDGIIYKKDIKPGSYKVTIESLADEKYSGYTVAASTKTVEVKEEIVYKKVDVENEVKQETEVNAAKEDTKVAEVVVESTLQDTVQWVESKVIGSAYNEVAKSAIPDPVTLALTKAFLRMCKPQDLTDSSTAKPTEDPSVSAATEPAQVPTAEASQNPSSSSAAEPTQNPDDSSAAEPTEEPITPTTTEPTEDLSAQSTAEPTEEPSAQSTAEPTKDPSAPPTETPTADPTEDPSAKSTAEPIKDPSAQSTAKPTEDPSAPPTETPTTEPTQDPSAPPTETPTTEPTQDPSAPPTETPTAEPTQNPTAGPTTPSPSPTQSPEPTESPEPTMEPDPDMSGSPSPEPSGSPSPSPSPAPTATPEPQKGKLTVDQTVLSGIIGAKMTAKVTASEFTEDMKVVYSISSSAPEVAEAAIDTDGTVRVTGISAGTAVLTITANYEDGDDETKAEATISVAVGDSKTLVLDQTSATMYATLSVTVKAVLTNALAEDPTVTAESSDPKIATVSVDKTAVTITGVAEGSAVITVKYEESGEEVSATCAITVKQHPMDDKTTMLKTTDGQQVYVVENGNYREATPADYYTADKFYVKGEVKYTGWQTLGGKVYYFTADCKTVTGEQVIQGARYNFASDGSLVVGNGTMGIDVSKWNGTIDWNAVKNSGVSYVIIRCGYRGSSTGKLIVDPKFEANIRGAASVGLKVGIYFFSQAVDEIEAVEEASMVLGQIKNYTISYPVFIDVEASEGRGDAIDKGTRTAVCRAFCQTIQSAGYTAGIYSNKTWLEEKVDAQSLGVYKIWLAQYATEPTYTGRYDLWQYKANGNVSGISGNVDLNISYLGY